MQTASTRLQVLPSPAAHGLIAARTAPRRVRTTMRLRPWPLLLVAALIIGAAATLAMITGGSAVARLSKLWSVEFDDLARRAGLGIDEVTVSGHRFADDNDIYGALDLANVRSMLRFDSRAARQRIERISWIATAEITRAFPGRLDIHVTERQPFALWQRGGAEFLIDAQGRVLQRVDASSIDHLPRVVGEGAAEEAATLLTTVARHESLATRFVSAERIGERRWTLHLAGGITMHLPADGHALVLERLAQSGRLERLLADGRRTIDLRGRGRVAVRSSPAGTSDRARVSSAAGAGLARKE